MLMKFCYVMYLKYLIIVRLNILFRNEFTKCLLQSQYFIHIEERLWKCKIVENRAIMNRTNIVNHF